MYHCYRVFNTAIICSKRSRCNGISSSLPPPPHTNPGTKEVRAKPYGRTDHSHRGRPLSYCRTYNMSTLYASANKRTFNGMTTLSVQCLVPVLFLPAGGAVLVGSFYCLSSHSVFPSRSLYLRFLVLWRPSMSFIPLYYVLSCGSCYLRPLYICTPSGGGDAPCPA